MSPHEERFWLVSSSGEKLIARIIIVPEAGYGNKEIVIAAGIRRTISTWHNYGFYRSEEKFLN